MFAVLDFCKMIVDHTSDMNFTSHKNGDHYRLVVHGLRVGAGAGRECLPEASLNSDSEHLKFPI